ncbi:MAG TPA: polysaccharide deacetylase family protein [Archangium sp.]|jgi:peptidoglycan/xylan/chitin deacetylase (PgdA/CDA1 family)|uniref:polysaccharide deacetylase family protein n=1 Tax=Archangium sp. TaxID=1872627 RepID=UPI002ED8B459
MQTTRNATYTVQPKDTLGSIAKAKLGDARRWSEIAALNPDVLPDPNRVVVGMTIELPPTNPAETPAPPSRIRGLFWSERFPGRAALTFDDGPHPVNTPKVLDILKKAGVKATFFVVGTNVRKYPELVRRIVAEGHALGGHSDDHPDLAKVDRAEVARQIAELQSAVNAALGHPYDLWQVRPPYGSMDSVVKEVLQSSGRMAVMWTVDSRDWRFRRDDSRIVQSVFSPTDGIQVRGGAILFHDIHSQTVRVLEEVVNRLKRARLTLVTTEQLLRQKYPEVSVPAVS